MWHLKLAFFLYFGVCVYTKPALQWTAKWILVFSYPPCACKALLVSSVLSSGHPWVRSDITGVVTAEPLSSTTDWAPPRRSRHVSTFPGPKCHCVLVFVFALVSRAFSLRCMENENRCVGTFCGQEAPRVVWWVTSLTCITSASLWRCPSARRSLKCINTHFLNVSVFRSISYL